MIGRTIFRLAVLALAWPAPSLLLAQERNLEAIELTGRASGFWETREWRSYYWREDFSFLLDEGEEEGKQWRVISREPTPAYAWRMGPTYTGLEVDWEAGPRVKVLCVSGVDRQPAEFYDFKLDESQVATALVVWVEAGDGEWREFYVNNWFHKWGEAADAAIYQAYADRCAPYDIYGFIAEQAAPFSAESQVLIERHPASRMFHGMIRTAQGSQFGYEIVVQELVGPDDQGNGVVFHGNASAIPPLETTPEGP